MYTEYEGVYLSDEECMDDFEHLQDLYNVDIEEQMQKLEMQMQIQEEEMRKYEFEMYEQEQMMEKYLEEMMENDEEFCPCI